MDQKGAWDVSLSSGECSGPFSQICLSPLCCAVPGPPFQNPECGGQVIWNHTVTLGCIPLSPAIMQDFQDFVNFLAGGYSEVFLLTQRR